MCLNKAPFLFFLVLILFLIFTQSCRRSEENFNEQYWRSGDSFTNLTGTDFLMPGAQKTLEFKISNVLDSSQKPEFVSWVWGNDTTLIGRKYRILNCDTRDLDILIQEQLLFWSYYGIIACYSETYTQTLFNLHYAFEPIDSTYFSFGVRNHRVQYSYQSPIKYGEFAGYRRRQVQSRIDSFADFGDFSKQVDITFMHQFGITKVHLKKIRNLGNKMDTVEHFVLERLK